MEALRKYLERYTSVSVSDWELIKAEFSRKDFAKNELILEEGQTCRYFYFLEKGLIRYFILHDGNDLTRYFTVAPYCFTSKESFRNRKPATENIQALENCTTWRISLESSNKLMSVKAWENFTRNFLHEVQSQMEEMLLETRMETAETRYYRLAERYPELIKKIPLKYLSGYLGIAPQSLSRIRKKQK